MSKFPPEAAYFRCLEVISALFWVLTIPNVKNKSLDPTQFMKLVFDYCKEKLSYSEIKYLRPTSCILTAVIKSSGNFVSSVSRFTSPNSLKFWRKTSGNFAGIFWNFVLTAAA